MKDLFSYSTVLGIFALFFLSFSSGVGVYTFYYAKGASYFSDNPKACVNCHVMQGQYNSWHNSSHKSFTTCNSCHAPKDLLGKYATKAINGFNHSWAFTFDSYIEPIQIKQWNKNIALNSCVGCHDNVQHQSIQNDKSVSCLHCHGNVGH